jgi:hypothetical protein
MYMLSFLTMKLVISLTLFIVALMAISVGLPPLLTLMVKRGGRMKPIVWVIMSLLFTIANGMAEQVSKEGASDKTIVIDIPSDLPVPPSAEKVAPIHPFFAAPSPGSEVMEKLQELEERIEKLEKNTSSSERGKNEG